MQVPRDEKASRKDTEAKALAVVPKQNERINNHEQNSSSNRKRKHCSLERKDVSSTKSSAGHLEDKRLSNEINRNKGESNNMNPMENSNGTASEGRTELGSLSLQRTKENEIIRDREVAATSNDENGVEIPKGLFLTFKFKVNSVLVIVEMVSL